MMKLWEGFVLIGTQAIILGLFLLFYYLWSRKQWKEAEEEAKLIREARQKQEEARAKES